MPLLDPIRRILPHRKRLSTDERLSIYRRLLRLLRSGNMTVTKALSVLYDQESGDGRHPERKLARLIDLWIAAIKNASGGSVTLGTAMGEAVPPIERAVLSAGVGPHLISALDGIDRMVTTRRTIERDMFLAMLRPRIGRVIMLGIMVGAYNLMLPIMDTIKPINEWSGVPWLFAEGLRIVTLLAPLLLAVAVVIPMISTYAQERMTGKLRDWLDRNVISWRLYRICEGVGVLYALAALVQASSADSVALARIARTASPYTASKLEPILAEISKGTRPTVSRAWRHVQPEWPTANIVFDIESALPSGSVSLGNQYLTIADEALRDITNELKQFEIRTAAIAMVSVVAVIMTFVLAFANVVMSIIDTMPI
jgi:hypothetical protein